MRVTAGVYVVVERGCYLGKKTAKSPQAHAHAHEIIHKYTNTGGRHLHFMGPKGLDCVYVCECVCSPAAGFMPHRVSLPAR